MMNQAPAVYVPAVPPYVQQLAAQYQLGMPQQRYADKITPPVALLICGILNLPLGLFILVGSTLTKSFSTGTPGLIVGLIFTGISMLCLLLGALALRRHARRPETALYLCPGGVILVEKGRAQAARWEQVEAYSWQKVEGDESPSTFHYELRRRDGVLLKTYLNGLGQRGQYHEDLAHAIEGGVIQAHLPGVLASFQAGNVISFGPISVSLQGVSQDQGGSWVPWNAIESVYLPNELKHLARIALNGQQAAWYEGEVSRYPKAVLARLAEQMIQQRVNQQLPPMLAAYQAGSPVAFGSLILSLQGVSVPGAPLQPWQTVRKLEVDLAERKVQIWIYGRFRIWQELPTWMTPDANMLNALKAYR